MGENILSKTQTITATSTVVLPVLRQGQRTALIVTNISTGGQTVTLNWGGEATANNGVVLYPGGTWSESRDAAFIPSNKDVWAVASGAGATIAVHERVQVGGL